MIAVLVHHQTSFCSESEILRVNIKNKNSCGCIKRLDFNGAYDADAPHDFIVHTNIYLEVGGIVTHYIIEFFINKVF